MTKELIICIIIIALIFGGNAITENYTEECITETTESLSRLREEINKDDVNLENVRQEMDEIYNDWSDKHDKLAYYIEHDELEKVKTELTGLRGYIEQEEYSQAVPELDKSVYILEHIKEKTVINLKNIF